MNYKKYLLENKQDNLGKEHDKLLSQIRKLLDSGNDADFKKAKELKKKSDIIFTKMFDIKKIY